MTARLANTTGTALGCLVDDTRHRLSLDERRPNSMSGGLAVVVGAMRLQSEASHSQEGEE